ncbi:hypothetical protein [Actinobacillus pleuropneumoniae]|uniref:hypothetical protein n=1 Tax=Actinobacillus pleuropneumoniae TaxID=715 RepID=UPI00072161AF|nr:hypothetical protein [Actinobacillus pleuropneumoniae]QXP21743.1 hypothetical protein KV188_05965 [Actinobacillus pleuropneumoniae serovar 8 str. 405]CUU53161.1 hypothetical protein MIDG2331_01928 [Actinobacillus pleuropneumoniae serovar 8]
MTNNTKPIFAQDSVKISEVPLTAKISAEGYNLRIKNQTPPPRPTTPPVNQKKS